MITRSFKECLEEMREINESQQSTIEYLREKLRTYDKEKEIAERDKEISRFRNHSICVMSDKEMDADVRFRTKHWKNTGCKNGNHYIYDLVGAGLGVDITIICPVCGERENITDISSW